MGSDPDSLDPRLSRELGAASVMNMLFEGLLRIDNQGQLQPAIASSYTVSDDRLTYTFKLRDSRWSNGDPVTASDFVYAWQTLLAPGFPAPNAFQLFSIKNAEAAKRGSVPTSAIGVIAKDPQTLIVILEKPTAYFPELTAFHALFPINRRIAEKEPSWADGNQQQFSSNGPFTLDHWDLQSEVVLVKNPFYWDQQAVTIERITLLPLESSTALKLFEQNELDWIGSPLSSLPPDAMASLKLQGSLNSSPAAGTHWLRLNTVKPPLNDPRARRALALAIDRATLITHILQGNQQVATAIVPSSSSWTAGEYFADNDVVEARKLWLEALNGEPAPPLTLSYGYSERHHKIAQALQQQWHTALGIEVALEGLEAKTFFERLKHGQYTIANGSWFADFRDPINFLTVFKEKANGTNNTGWEDPEYRKLLDVAAGAPLGQQRNEAMRNAESLLITQMPVIPLFYYTFDYQKNPKIHNIGVSELGLINIRDAKVIGD